MLLKTRIRLQLPGHRYFGWVLLAATLSSSSPVFAQKDSLPAADSIFAAARQLAFNGRFGQGREMALSLAQQYPQDLELKTFIGRTYAWEHRFPEARMAFAEVMALNPALRDNYLAWSDTERWADDPAKGLAVLEKALHQFKDDPEFLYRKARLLSVSGQLSEAKLLVQKLLRQAPHHGPAYVLLQELRSQLLDNNVSAGFSYEDFGNNTAPAHFAFVQGSRATSLGSVTARVNYTGRFGKGAVLPEVDLYPRLFRGFYGYLNAGFSNGSLFAKQRYGAELFASLPGSFEASAGTRYLFFGPGSRVSIYTGSVGYYTGNYWLSFRPYITPDSARASFSASLTLRRYFRNPEQYFSVRIGAGFLPELFSTQTSSGTASKAFYNLRSQSLNLAYQHPLTKRWTVNGNLGLGRQQTVLVPGEYSACFNAAFSVKYRYR